MHASCCWAEGVFIVATTIWGLREDGSAYMVVQGEGRVHPG
ncbi:MAG: hypothetical protein AVDCRST_MAG48-2370 [uncultured Friedmanniella sp.]|uniref:Uncharacterized protein n=1 Tax=uncultured Friedmanniella sp. TaxID=335381 RepID=A0A6J4KVH2_9ACTN|nr:MAG: hypothetical protein AVDCRST_MAG48-2370 [uncultured Friedmanniella sp.]